MKVYFDGANVVLSQGNDVRIVPPQNLQVICDSARQTFSFLISGVRFSKTKPYNELYKQDGTTYASYAEAFDTFTSFGIASITGGDASAANQEIQISLLQNAATDLTMQQILSALQNGVFLDPILWEVRQEGANAYYREVRIRNQSTGNVDITYTDISTGLPIASLPAGVVPVHSAQDRQVLNYRWRAVANGTGYSNGDWIANTQIFDVDGSGSILSNTWYNLTAGAVIAAPNGAHLEDPANAISNAVGAKTDAPASDDTGTFSLISILKRALGYFDTLIARTTTLGQKAKAGSVPVVIASDQDTLPVSVSAPARVIKTFTATLNATGTNTLVSLTPQSDGESGTAALSFSVTAGKKLRIQSFSLCVRNTTNAPTGATATLYMSNSGDVTTASTVLCHVASGTNTNTSNMSGSEDRNFSDGIELSGTMEFGVALFGSTTAECRISVVAYEY